MWRSESVTARLMILAVSSAVIRNSMVLPLDLLILVPSMPRISDPELSSASACGKIGRAGSTRPPWLS